MALLSIYYGLRENMIAEVAAWDPCQIGIKKAECRYLVMAYGDEQYDTEWFATKRSARDHARYFAAQYPGVDVREV